MVFAIWYTYQPGEIFGRLGDWLDKHLPDKIKPAVFECAVCMCYWYGSILYWLVWGLWLDTMIVAGMVVVVIAAMGMNAVLNKLFPQMKLK